ncbi:MAG: aspartate carbamoyltransferase catalytic subunit [Clostridiales bacterium]|nr:aspartate carbamoyltransferase catalytic subunit [Clostridiales bacterium]
MNFKRKDFIGLMDVSAEEIKDILETAETMKVVLNQKNKKAPYLQGKSVILLFYEKSTRAKLSYELAAQYLSANCVEISVDDPKTETLFDMGRTIDQMGGDFIILRNPYSGSAGYLADKVKASVINAGDGINENPTQALLDLLTIKELKGGFKGIKVAICGDVAGSRVTRSNIWGLTKLGAEVRIAAPPTMIPDKIEEFNVKVFYDIREACRDVDVIMCLKLQEEGSYGSKLASFAEYKDFFKLDSSVISGAKEDVIVMHPGSPDRKVEISSEIVDSEKCIIDDQITNGVAVRMAILYLLSLGKGIGV